MAETRFLLSFAYSLSKSMPPAFLFLGRALNAAECFEFLKACEVGAAGGPPPRKRSSPQAPLFFLLAPLLCTNPPSCVPVCRRPSRLHTTRPPARARPSARALAVVVSAGAALFPDARTHHHHHHRRHHHRGEITTHAHTSPFCLSSSRCCLRRGGCFLPSLSSLSGAREPRFTRQLARRVPALSKNHTHVLPLSHARACCTRTPSVESLFFVICMGEAAARASLLASP